MQNLQEMIDSQPTEIHDQVYEWEPDDFKLYESFMIEVIAAYVRADAALHECGLGEAAPPNTSFYKPARKRDALRNTDFFESTSSFVLPCKYPKTANSMFDSMRQVYRQNCRRRLFKTMEDLPNTIAVNLAGLFSCGVALSKEKGILLARTWTQLAVPILQKYIEGSEDTTDIAVFTDSVVRSAQQDKLELAIFDDTCSIG
ncbi:hypothetical protein JG687_00018984 [Phytophthora cactorum]|uniref:Uncharacterized protein n=1 Tax=Phytophthora cactorum TaxID=29920 RepID=A0A8T1TP56_9STRA|nr:hypothetical protein JG687_00018984 [Phytophthora cactorum]